MPGEGVLPLLEEGVLRRQRVGGGGLGAGDVQAGGEQVPLLEEGAARRARGLVGGHGGDGLGRVPQE